MASQLTLQKKTQWQWLPVWMVHLLGYSSLAATLISFMAQCYKIYVSKQQLPDILFRKRHSKNPKLDNLHDKPLKRSSSNLSCIKQQSPPSVESTHGNVFRALSPTNGFSRILSSLASVNPKRKERLTISLKNTILWNPSVDLATPNHAFRENTTALLSQIHQSYDLYMIIQINSETEQDQIQQLLEKAKLYDVRTTQVIYCSTAEDKLAMIRRIHPHIHIEGGSEFDDGADVVRTLTPDVPNIIWTTSRLRRDSTGSNLNITETSDTNVEMIPCILTSSVARHIGFDAAIKP
ncbi:uncharacterized protein BYT42DRAFT_647857 [Radiomyces spectabilis]|uniref:uncharacterized protein n=1 Tax=Radiomyces spectabilis TaxID=64574 RepID=UPI00221F46C4|nr:uncharacterized protein BYT42DRAFT_647857 [Radiomyces spectabilis]KAI8370633.1 hypothetical protein BYT42DRAFT_647857 [Radiomyces spectabilis]